MADVVALAGHPEDVGLAELLSPILDTGTRKT